MVGVWVSCRVVVVYDPESELNFLVMVKSPISRDDPSFCGQ